MKKKYTLIVCICLLVLGIALAVALIALSQKCEPTNQALDPSGDKGLFSIRFVYMGRRATAKEKPGDCLILKSPDGKVMVIDAGYPRKEYTDNVIKVLDSLKVKKIDYLVASHPHDDHVGGFPALMEKYEIGALCTSALAYESSKDYRAYMDMCRKKGIEHIILKDSDTFQFGDGVTVDIYNPVDPIEYPDGYPKRSTAFVNDQSLVMKFTYGESTFITAGDLYIKGEKEVVQRWGADALHSDIAKANHHGYNSTSSSSAWLRAVDPKLVVITNDILVDDNEGFIMRLRREGKPMCHICLDGTVLVRTSGDGTYKVITEHERTDKRFGSAPGSV